MNMYDSVFTRSKIPTEQIAGQIFELLPDEGPIMVIMSRDGRIWPSDPERFSKLDVGQDFLKALCEKIDDGAEPIVTHADDSSIVASQLATEENNCGYVVLILPRYSPESTLVNIDLIEIMLNQVVLIAKLMERNSLLSEQQINQYKASPQTTIASN